MPNLNISAIRSSIAAITRALSDRDIKVTSHGSQAYVQSVDGVPIRVNVPNIPDEASEELIAAVNGFLDHEVGHLLYTDFGVTNDLSVKMGKAVFDLYNIVEDTRIEREMQKRFRGSRKNLDSVSSFFIKNHIEPSVQQAKDGGDEKSLYSVLMMPAFRSWAGQSIFGDFMSDHWDSFSPVAKKLDHLVEKFPKVRSTQGSIDLAIEVYDALKPEDKPEDEPEDEPEDKSDEKGEDSKSDEKGEDSKSDEKGEDSKSDEKGEDSKSDEKGEDSDEGADEDSDEDSDEEPEDKSDEKGEDSDEDSDEDSGGGSGGSEDSDSKDKSGDEPSDASDAGGRDFEVDDAAEFDVESLMEDAVDFDEAVASEISKMAALAVIESEYRVFTTDEDVVEPFKVGSGYDDSMIAEMDDSTKKLVGPLQKTIERLVIAKSHSRNVPGKTSGRVNSSSLFRLKTGDNRVFKQKEEAETKDVAVSLVVDCSGSMNGEYIKIALQSAYALSTVLSRLNISNEVIGFTTKTPKSRSYSREMHDERERLGVSYSRTEPIYMPIFKGFDEKLGVEQKKRMAYGYRSSGYLRNNVDGESVVIAAKRLMQRPEIGKKMFVLSDGRPCADGDFAAMDRDLVESVRKIENSGVGVVGIGIGDDCVRRYYSKNVVITGVDELPDLIMKELKNLLV